MGSKGHGTYAKLYGDVWTHPKTLRLADSLEALGVPRRWAVREAVGQLHEMLVWCLGSSDTGDVGHLRPEMFARVVGWTEARSAAALVEAWRASGYLDQDGNSWRLHDFDECASDLLAKRRARAEARNARARGRTTDAERTPPGEPTDAARTPDGRRADALARASGNGSGNGNGKTPTESSLSDPASPVGSAPTPARPRRPRQPKPAAPTDATDAVAAAAPPRAPTVDLLEAWKRSAAAAGYPTVVVNGQHARTLSDAWKAAGGDFAAVVRAVDAYFADRSDFVVRNGHAIGEFGRTSARWLAVAAGTAPAAALPLSRQASAIGAAFDEAGRRLAAGATPAPEEVDRFTDALPPAVAASAAAALPATPW